MPVYIPVQDKAIFYRCFTTCPGFVPYMVSAHQLGAGIDFQEMVTMHHIFSDSGPLSNTTT